MDARRKKALERAAKYLAQSRSDNEHEADTAQRRFKEQCDKHGFTLAEVEEFLDDGERVYEDVGALEDDFWQIRVALAVADRTGCRAMKKNGRLVFEGSPRRTRRASAIYLPVTRDVQNGCEGVYASYGHPPIFARVLRPILLEEAARAVAERVLGGEQPARFPVSRELQIEIFDWSKAMTGSAGCARMHMDWARRDGRVVGLSVPIPEI